MPEFWPCIFSIAIFSIICYAMAMASDDIVRESNQVRKERKERLARLFAETETMDDVYAHLANGGSLIQLCETWDVRYSDVVAWIDGDDGRRKRYQDGMLKRGEWENEIYLSQVRLIANFDIRKLYEKGKLKNIEELDADTARMVQSVEVDELFEGTGREREQVGETKKIKLWDKLKAVEMGMKNRRQLIDKSENETTLKLEDIVGRSMEPSSSATSAPLPSSPAAPAPAAPASAAPVPTPDAAPKPHPAPEAPSAAGPLSPAAPAAEAQPAPVAEKAPDEGKAQTA